MICEDAGLPILAVIPSVGVWSRRRAVHVSRKHLPAIGAGFRDPVVVETRTASLVLRARARPLGAPLGSALIPRYADQHLGASRHGVIYLCRPGFQRARRVVLEAERPPTGRALARLRRGLIGEPLLEGEPIPSPAPSLGRFLRVARTLPEGPVVATRGTELVVRETGGGAWPAARKGRVEGWPLPVWPASVSWRPRRG